MIALTLTFTQITGILLVFLGIIALGVVLFIEIRNSIKELAEDPTSE